MPSLNIVKLLRIQRIISKPSLGLFKTLKMAENSDKALTIRRILVAVDHSKRSGTALEAAAMVAKITKANIHGLYVQEEHWQSLSGRPSATFVNELTGKTQLLEENRLEREAKLIAGRLKRRLRAISHQHEIAHQWRSVRGEVIEEILKAGKEADLITIGRRGSSMLQKKKLGSTARAVIERSEKPVLVLTGNLILSRAITVVYDASEECKKCLRFGLSIAKKNRSRLFILVVNNRGEKETDRDKEIEQMIDKARIPVNVTTLDHPSIGNFIHIIKRQRPGLMLISKKQPLLKDGSPEVMLQYLDCAILLMN